MSADEPAAKRLKASGAEVGRPDHRPTPSHQQPDVDEPSRLLGLPTPIPPPAVPGLQPSQEPETETRSRQSTASGPDEVAEVYTETRMLQDPTGRLRGYPSLVPSRLFLLIERLVYLGDSATLSYLQFIRMIVESVNGPSQFTTDPSRHRLMEATSTLPPDIRAPVLLPDRKTADVLVKSYFTNVSSFVIAIISNDISNDIDCFLSMTRGLDLVRAVLRDRTFDPHRPQLRVHVRENEMCVS